MPKTKFQLRADPTNPPSQGFGVTGVDYPIHTRFIFPGRVGILQTLHAMRNFSLSASSNPDFKKWAVSIGQDAPTRETLIRVLFDYVHRIMRYTDDPTGPNGAYNDFLKDPVLIKSEIERQGFSSGDCDDFVMIFSSLLASFGVSHAMIALALPEMGDGLNHVVVGIPQGGGRYYLLDTVTGESEVTYDITENLTVNVL